MGGFFPKDCGAERAFSRDEDQYHKPPRDSLPLQHKVLFVSCVLAGKGLKKNPGLFSSSPNSSNCYWYINS